MHVSVTEIFILLFKARKMLTKIYIKNIWCHFTAQLLVLEQICIVTLSIYYILKERAFYVLPLLLYTLFTKTSYFSSY